MGADAAKSRQVLIYRSRLRRVFIFNGNASAKYSKKNITVVIFDILLEKNGFMMEGILRSNAVRDGKAIDMVMY